MTIAVFGSINMDITAYVDRLPLPGETLHGSSYIVGLGGKGANQAVAARKLGSEVAFICRIGADDFGKSARREIAAYGVGGELMREDAEGATGIAIIKVGGNAENIITVVGGSNLRMDESDAARAGLALANARVLLLQLEVPLAASLAAAAVVRRSGGMVILDPAPAPAAGLPQEVLSAVDLITPNETETALLLGQRPETQAQGLEAARALRARGVKSAIVKLGGKGLAVSSPDGEGMLEPFKVKAIDTVAAGDTFNGALAHGLERGLPILEAARFASAAAAISVTRKGAAAASPSRAEVEEFLAAH
jgi:ribokinase